MRSFLLQLALVLAIGVSPRLAQGQHLDVSPTVENGRIVTNGYDDATSTLLPGVRVFGYDFQEDPLDPFFAADPGFNSSAGSGLPASSQLRFNILSGGALGLPGNLTYWDGVGSVSFGAVPAGEALVLNLGAQNRTVDSDLGLVAGFSLGTVAGDGSIHRHLNSFLLGPGGSDPTNGIYLFALELTSSNPSVTASAPFFVVFNNGLDEAVHDAALDHVQAAIVPEPGSCMLTGTGLAILVAAALRWRRSLA